MLSLVSSLCVGMCLCISSDCPYLSRDEAAGEHSMDGGLSLRFSFFCHNTYIQEQRNDPVSSSLEIEPFKRRIQWRGNVNQRGQNDKDGLPSLDTVYVIYNITHQNKIVKLWKAQKVSINENTASFNLQGCRSGIVIHENRTVITNYTATFILQ